MPLEKKSGKYIPSRGDIIWISFNPQSGHEQSGHRPGIVVSPREYNEKVGLVLCCPITSKVKGYPFEVNICIENKIDGVILSDQIKSFDWKERQAKYIGTAPKSVLGEVIERLTLLIRP